MDIQKLFDALSDGDRRTRGNYHLTLGKLIATLEGLPYETPVEFGGEFTGQAHPDYEMSYRGYYSDLAIAPTDKPCVAGALLDRMKKALDATYEGYKGGDFVMDARTPLWRADYGDLGEAIVAADHRDGKLYLVCKPDEYDG